MAILLAVQMKLSEMARVRVGNLSGGWKRRVSSSVAFLANPQVVLLDEPTAGAGIKIPIYHFLITFQTLVVN